MSDALTAALPARPVRPIVPASAVPEVVTPALLRGWPLPLDEDGDKHDRGSVLVIGGSPRTPGAVLLAGLAALRAGAGLLQLATAETVAASLAIAVPEALVEPLALRDGVIDVPPAIEALRPRVGLADAVLFGPGMEDEDAATQLLVGLLPHLGAQTVLVVDALGLACLGRAGRAATAPLAGRLALTPNQGEATDLLSRAAGSGSEDGADEASEQGADGGADQHADQHPDQGGDPSALARCVAEAYGAVVTLHGATCAPDGRAWTDPAGSVGLATSGSGDVLAGLVAGAAARCGDAAQAACWGSHLHGAAGDRRRATVGGQVGFLARELLDEVPGLLGDLEP